jgi:CBS-domain-containing membrane protein
MSATVRDCMNPKLVYLREGDRTDLALQPILDFGISAVPVIDDDDRPVGLVALRDLVDPKRRHHWTSTPALTIDIDAPIAMAARGLVDNDAHQLVVVDAKGRAAGMLSALDVVRALLDLPARHPKAIETFDRAVART